MQTAHWWRFTANCPNYPVCWLKKGVWNLATPRIWMEGAFVEYCVPWNFAATSFSVTRTVLCCCCCSHLQFLPCPSLQSPSAHQMRLNTGHTFQTRSALFAMNSQLQLLCVVLMILWSHKKTNVHCVTWPKSAGGCCVPSWAVRSKNCVMTDNSHNSHQHSTHYHTGM